MAITPISLYPQFMRQVGSTSLEGIVYAGGLVVAIEGEISAAVEGDLAVAQVETVTIPIDLSTLSVSVEDNHQVAVDGSIDVSTCK